MARTLLLLAALVGVTAAARLPLLDLPFERDEGEYAYIAWRLAHGELPYRDWVDQKPPGVFWVYRLALALPHGAVPAAHLVAAAFAAAAAVAVFFLARRFTTEGWAAAAAATFAVLAVDPAVQGLAANTESFMLLPLVLAQLAFLAAAAETRRRVAWSVACGALAGVAVAFKQVAAVQALALVALWPAYAPRGERLRRTWTFAARLALGAAAVWLPIALFFLARGGLGEMLSQVFVHNLAYARALPWSMRASALAAALASLSGTQVVVWGAAALGFATLARTGRTRELLFLAGGLFAGFLGVSASGYFFPHYFQQLLPPLAIAAALGAERASGMRAFRAAPRGLRAAAGVLALVSLPALSLAPFLLVHSPAEAVRRIYPTNHFAQMPALAARIAETTRPEDRVFVFGAEPEVLFLARRVSASRYIFLFPLYGPYEGALEKQKAVADEVARARPAAILLAPNNLLSLPGSDPWLTRWIEAYVRDGYRADAFLTVDPAGGTELSFGADGRAAAVPFGREPVAALYLRDAERGP